MKKASWDKAGLHIVLRGPFRSETSGRACLSEAGAALKHEQTFYSVLY